jgi:carboxynorspermidine decarboxylase
LKLIAETVDGFSASSYFEAKLARNIIGSKGTVHFTNPGLRSGEIGEISSLCDFISFNSLAQWRRLRKKVDSGTSSGLRINPQMSVVADERYDPCRRHSKLGVPLNLLVNIILEEAEELKQINGIHFHSNCEGRSAEPLLITVKHLDALAGDLLRRIEWINLGGGYLYREITSLEPFYEAVDLLKRTCCLDVYIEPGMAVVGHAGYIVSSVVDLFDNDLKKIAVLDTSVNHMPEVFELQYQPDIREHSSNGQYEYIIAGSTCLAGDLFGEYRFEYPLEVGSQLVFENMGAYSLVKANMFNGINLPKIYSITESGELILRKEYRYSDYISR